MAAKPWHSILKDEYNVPQEAIDHLVKDFPDGIGISDQDDFMNLFANEADVQDVVKSFDKVNNKPLAVSRIRRAWASLKEARAVKANSRTAPEQSESTELLPQAEMESLSDKFHKRYHLAWLADVEPSDHIVSRIAKELERGTMSPTPIEAVRSLADFQQRRQKRIQLGGSVDLTLGDGDEDEKATASLTASTFLTSLFTLCIAYARAGCNDRPAREGRPPESRTTPSTDYVWVPMDVMFRYYSRAAKAASHFRGSGSDLIAWLKGIDCEERQRWVEEARTSKLSLGEIVAKAPAARDVFFTPPSQSASRATTTKETAQLASPKKRTSDTLRDGTAICSAFNTRRGCKESDCTAVHACNVVLKSGRACGMRNHSALNCKNPRRG